VAIEITPGGILNEFKQDTEYKTKMGFNTKWPEYVRFVEGDQWPPATEKTKNMPRPVVNQCDFTVENKQSNILSQAFKIVFKPDEIPDDQKKAEEAVSAAEMFTYAEENILEDIDQDELNEDVVNDTLILGIGQWHYFWDNTIKGGQLTPFVGKLQGETIDPTDICYGNPKMKPSQTQKQPFIIIRHRSETDLLKERAKTTGENWQSIVPDKANDDERYDNAKQDIKNADMTTSYVKYYKQNGEVFWVEVTEGATVQKPRTLRPDGSERPFTLYPVEPLVFKRRKKCIYGRSIIGDMITNQRLLNTGLGLMFLSVQQTAWPKILAKVNALMQSITNEPGEIITDNFSTPGVDGIKYMSPPNFSQFPLLLTDKLIDLTRKAAGVTEVTSGEVIGANMAASAIIALQNQAKKPNEGYQNKLTRSMGNIGRIHEEFLKCYCNLPRPIKAKDKQGKEITKAFTGTDYADVNFRLDLSVTPRTTLDDSLQIAMLDKFVSNKWIDKYQYAKYAPKNTINQELAHDFESEKELLKQQQVVVKKTSDIVNALTPEEKEYLKNNPQLIDQIFGGMPDDQANTETA
jgi:hypothetical protein